jgi:hypothetical protein
MTVFQPCQCQCHSTVTRGPAGGFRIQLLPVPLRQWPRPLRQWPRPGARNFTGSLRLPVLLAVLRISGRGRGSGCVT